MTFKPSVHGWAFEDSFAVEGPAIGLGAAAPSLGLSGGMCWAALDRYLDGRALPEHSTAPETGSPLHAELHQRQIAALDGVWSRIRAWQTLPATSWRDRVPVPLTPGRGDIASLSRREWSRIRRSLKARRPILVTLIEDEDGYARASAARQVLAYDAARDGTTVVLSIYDPRRPKDDGARLAFSLRGPLEARLGGDAAIRGFFAVPYDRTPAAALRGQTFGDRNVLGLNRKVHGRPSGAAGPRVLHLVARDEDGALLHFHRRKGRHWEGANITEREELGAFELHSDPAALAANAGAAIHAFGRSYAGDLLHFRGGRRWRVANRTEHRRAGARFRLDGNPVPVALPFGGICVAGRGKDGSLVAYSARPLRGWRAEEVPPPAGGTISGDPVALRLGKLVHVVARGRNGHLLHFERTKGGWSAGDLMAQCRDAEPVSGPPALIVHGDRLHLFARTEAGGLLHMERDPEGQWAARVVATRIVGDPAATPGPAGVHAFAAAEEGGLIHAWRSADGSWRAEDVVETRPSVPRDVAPEGALVAWGDRQELRVLGRRGGALMQWVWRGDTDWVAGPASERAGVARRHEPGEDPFLVADRSGAFHVFATDGAGTVVHLEPVPWRAPGEATREEGKAAPARSAAKVARKPKSKAKPQPKAKAAKKAAKQQQPAAPAAAKRVAVPAGAGLPLLEGADVPPERPDPLEGLPLLDDLEPPQAASSPAAEAKPVPGRGGPEELEWEPTILEVEPTIPDAVKPTPRPAPSGPGELDLEPIDLEGLETFTTQKPQTAQKPPAKPAAPAPKPAAPEPSSDIPPLVWPD